MSPERIAELRKLISDYFASCTDPHWGYSLAERLTTEEYLFFVASRTAIPELLDEIERLKAALKFYGAEANYDTCQGRIDSDVQHDKGRRARDELKGGA